MKEAFTKMVDPKGFFLRPAEKRDENFVTSIRNPNTFLKKLRTDSSFEQRALRFATGVYYNRIKAEVER